jgi:hypothetical protein
MKKIIRCVFLFLLAALPAFSQESPYFVTYDHHLEEPGNLELETQTNAGFPRHGEPSYFAPYTELEYGINTRWTTELYLEGVSRSSDSTVFTGWRFENRFRPVAGEHLINPIFYVEYEHLNEASRIQKEVVGNATEFDVPNADSRHTRAHELETKLILSSNIHDWNISENFIAEKNLSHEEGVEFGYAFGFSRPLKTIASATNCHLCAENFLAGAELFGGLGSTKGFGFHDTAHYFAPAISWQVSNNSSLRFSPAIGLTNQSAGLLLRFGYSYEIRGFKDKLAGLFRGAK